MKSVLGCFIFLMMTTSQILAGNVYYVDATNGNDLNNGLSETSAWKTIAKVNEQSFVAGDSILFKRGEIWRENLIVPSSGNAGNLITFSSYGSGSEPVISGSDSMTGWENDSGNIWKKTGISIEPYIVIFNGIWGEFKTSKANLNANHEWYYDSGNDILYIYTNAGDPDSQWPGGIDVGQRNCGITISYKNFISIKNIEIKYANQNGIGSSQWNYCTIDNCNITMVGKCGIYLYNATNNTISNNTVRYSSWGIALESNADNNIIENNNISESRTTAIQTGGGGIGLYASDSNIIRYNYIYDAKLVNGPERQGDGILLDDDLPCSSNEVYYNIVTTHNDGMNVFGTSNLVYNNVFFDHAYVCIHIGNNASKNIIKNNIMMETGHANILLHGDKSATDNTLDHNCYYDPDSPFVISWNNTGQEEWGTLTLTEFQAYGKYEQHSVGQNPFFVGATNSNFALKTGSACIDAGTDTGLLQDHAGNTVPIGWGFDIGAYEYQADTPGIPVASLFAYPIEGIPPLDVSFDASGSYDPDGNITSYEWDFGDGNTGSGITVTHTYQNRGTYAAKLTVTDNDEQSASNSQNIKVGTPPVALFDAFPSSGNRPLIVEFDASISYDPDGEIVSYNWDFGDGTQGIGKKVFHTYYSYGDHTATLEITDDDGLSDSISINIKVMEMPYPPLNVKVRRVTNRGNSFTGFCRVEWRMNPKNNGRHNIVKYRIYRKIRHTSNSAYALIQEVNSSIFRYKDKSVEDIKELKLYAYAVSAVDDRNRESELSEATLVR